MRPSPKALEQREKKQLQAVRDKFFSGRDATQVSDDRAFRRLTQDRAEQNFKDRFTKPAGGSKTNLLQMTPDAPRSLAAERERLANLYGPTLGEIGSDMRFGLGRIAQDFKDRGAPAVRLIKDLYEKGKNFFAPPSGIEAVIPKPQAEGDLYQGQPVKNIISQPSNIDPSKMDIENFNKEYNFLSDAENFSNYIADNRALPSLVDLYNFSQNPQIDTNIGNFRLDDAFRGDPSFGYNNTVIINGVPVDLNATIGRGGDIGIGAGLMFKNGGTVDKYSGLGYKLR